MKLPAEQQKGDVEMRGKKRLKTTSAGKEEEETLFGQANGEK